MKALKPIAQYTSHLPPEYLECEKRPPDRTSGRLYNRTCRWSSAMALFALRSGPANAPRIDPLLRMFRVGGGGQVSAFLLCGSWLRQSDEYLDRLEAAGRKHPEVRECYLMTRGSDYVYASIRRVRGAFERIHKEVLSMLPSVLGIHSSYSIRNAWRAHGRSGHRPNYRFDSTRAPRLWR